MAHYKGFEGIKYTDQPKIGLVLVMLRLLVFTEMKLPTEVNF